jgi:hypothetical protein
MRMKNLFVIVLLSVSAFGSLPLGTVHNVSSVSCPAGFSSTATCSTAIVSCPGTTDLSLTYGFQNPIVTPVLGTVAFFAAGPGTSLSGEMISNYYSTFIADGIQPIEFIWSSIWWDTGVSTKSLLTAACRPATLGQYFHDSVHGSGKFSVLGSSAGAGAIAYWLAWYGGAGTIDFAELSSGPVFSDIMQGCRFPKWTDQTIFPTDGASYSDHVYYDNPSALTSTTGQTCLSSGGTTIPQDATWLAMSIVTAGWQASYSTPISAWLCNNGTNNSAGQANIFYSQIISAYSLTAISNCNGAEGTIYGVTPQGVSGFNAILADILGNFAS